MKANELRIGNHINHGTVFNIYYSMASKYVVDIVEGDKSFFLKECTPIPLTEEWLVKLGFFKHSKNAIYTGYSYANNNAIIRSWVVRHFNEKPTIGNRKKANLFFWGVVNIQYVHQLQNLYFALTGEELTLKK